MKEVIICGTFHFLDRFDIFSDEVQVQLEQFAKKLSVLAPTKIAVEFPAFKQDAHNDFYRAFDKTKLGENISFGYVERYGKDTEFTTQGEIAQIGFRLAELLGHERVYGVDEDIELSDELWTKCAPFLSDRIDRFWKYFNDTIAKTDGGIEDMYRIHNSFEYTSRDHGLYIALNRMNFGNYEGSEINAKWYERNLKIFSNLQNLGEDGDRIILLIGSAHVWILQELANADAEMRLIDLMI